VLEDGLQERVAQERLQRRPGVGLPAGTHQHKENSSESPLDVKIKNNTGDRFQSDFLVDVDLEHDNIEQTLVKRLPPHFN
jgi:hypothetical protein